MNILFSTQANKLDLFYNLSKKIEDISVVKNIGFYCADSVFFDSFSHFAVYILKQMNYTKFYFFK